MQSTSTELIRTVFILVMIFQLSFIKRNFQFYFQCAGVRNCTSRNFRLYFRVSKEGYDEMSKLFRACNPSQNHFSVFALLIGFNPFSFQWSRTTLIIRLNHNGFSNFPKRKRDFSFTCAGAGKLAAFKSRAFMLSFRPFSKNLFLVTFEKRKQKEKSRSKMENGKMTRESWNVPRTWNCRTRMIRLESTITFCVHIALKQDVKVIRGGRKKSNKTFLYTENLFFKNHGSK